MQPENIRVNEGTSDPADTIYKPYWWLNIGADGGVLLSMYVRLKCSFSGPPLQAQCMHVRTPDYKFLNQFRLAIMIAGIHSSHTITCPDMKAGI